MEQILVGLVLQLETDLTILIKKAKDAQKKYGVHAVVANELLTRRKKVTVVTIKEEEIVEKDDLHPDLEMPLVSLLKEKHSAYIMNAIN
jgi:phosphopantothenate-cysteine ligase